MTHVHSQARLDALHDTGLLDSPSEEAFDRLTRLGATALGVPIALVSLLDGDREFFKSSVGLDGGSETNRSLPLSHSFCQHVVATGEPLVIDDALANPAFRDNPYVRDHGVRAYAGVPLVTPGGHALGTFCVIDRIPRQWAASDIRILTDLAAATVTEIVLRGEIAERTCIEQESARLLRALKLEQHRILSLFEQAPGFIATVSGPEHRFEMANRAYYQLVGFREIIGKPITEAFPEVAEQGFVAMLDKVLETGEPFNAVGARVLLQNRPDAEPDERFVDFACQPLVDADGTRSGIVFHGVDVTEQVRAAHTVTESEERYRLLFDGNPLPMWVYECESLRFVAVNTAALAHYGYTRDEFLSMSLTDIRTADHAVFVRQSAHDAGQGEHYVPRSQHRLKNGTAIDVDITSRPITFGNRPARLVLAHDVTDRAVLEAQLRQAQKMEAIGQLAGGVAHDFNNLLTVITGGVSFVREHFPQDTPIVEELTMVEEAASRAAQLTHQLLAFSRKQVLQPKLVDLNRIVRGVEPMLRRLIAEDIQIVIIARAASASVFADPGQLEQVLLNLAVNARDAMPNGGRLVIETGVLTVTADDAARVGAGNPPGAYVRLEVRDTGIGMNEATLARAFEPFFTTKGPGSGTGLGLATVYGIVQQSGGYIRVSSVLDCGTNFEIDLPFVDGVETLSSVESEAPRPARSSGTVLLVEDEAPVRAIARRILVRQGYTVIEAANGRDALLCAQGHEGKIDVVVTDMVMPEMSGRAFADEFSALNPDTPVLFVSGYTDDEILRRGALAPRTAFLEKPFTPDKLIAAVRRVLVGREIDETRRVASPAGVS